MERSQSAASGRISASFIKDPSRESNSETKNDLRKSNRRPDPYLGYQFTSDAKAKYDHLRSAPPIQCSKHESAKLSRKIHDYNTRQRALQKYSLQSSIGGLRDDPFVSLPIASRHSVMEAADYWVNSWAPAQTPSYVNTANWRSTIFKVFSIAIANEGAFESQVALAQSYRCCNGDKGELEEPTKEVLYHQNRAMLSLRKHLEAGDVSAGPLLSSLNLLIMSIVQVDKKAYDFHRKGLERMIQTPPDDPATILIHHVIEGYLVTIRFYFHLLTFQTRSAEVSLDSANNQIVNKLTFPRHPFYPALSADIATLPSGFRELALELSLPVELIQVLKVMARWNALIAPKSGIARKAQAWFSSDAKNTLEILEQLYFSTSRLHTVCLPLCMVLMLYCITVHKLFHAPKIYKRLLHDAVFAIRCFDPITETQQECRLWMAVVVTGCARDAGAGNARIETHGMLRDLASSLTDDLNTSSNARYKNAAKREKEQQQPNGVAMDWDAVETIMKKFFWYEIFAPSWRRCWELEVETSDVRLSCQKWLT
jgi:hypothetical protein